VLSLKGSSFDVVVRAAGAPPWVVDPNAYAISKLAYPFHVCPCDFLPWQNKYMMYFVQPCDFPPWQNKYIMYFVQPNHNQGILFDALVVSKLYVSFFETLVHEKTEYKYDNNELWFLLDLQRNMF
jgi:hypothetical protein